jgi:hypothetical protein
VAELVARALDGQGVIKIGDNLRSMPTSQR